MSAYYQSLVESFIEPVSETRKDIIYRCPFCEGATGSGHLYINYDKNVYHCYKCDIGGRDIKTLLTRMGYSFSENIPNSILSRQRDNTTSKLMSVIGDLKKSKEPEEKKDFSQDLSICTEYFLLHTQPLSPRSLQYLYERGVTQEEIDVYGLREGINRRGQELTIRGKVFSGNDYSDRVLVPSLIRGDTLQVSYFVGRDITGTKAQKYLNPPSEIAYSSEDIWNLDLARKVSNTVIICEGVFTAIAAGRGKYNAVATYGKSLSEISNSMGAVKSQADKLIEAGFKTYIVAYDADAQAKIDDTCAYLSMRGVHVRFLVVPPVHGPHTDISDLTTDEYHRLLSESCEYNSSSRLRLIVGTSL